VGIGRNEAEFPRHRDQVQSLGAERLKAHRNLKL
jgi:hypothetical protein